MSDFIWYVFVLLVGGYWIMRLYEIISGRTLFTGSMQSNNNSNAYRIPEDIPKKMIWNTENIPRIRDTMKEIISLLGKHGTNNNYCNCIFATYCFPISGYGAPNQKIDVLLSPVESYDSGPGIEPDKEKEILLRHDFTLDNGYFYHEYSILQDPPANIANDLISILIELNSTISDQHMYHNILSFFVISMV